MTSDQARARLFEYELILLKTTHFQRLVAGAPGCGWYIMPASALKVQNEPVRVFFKNLRAVEEYIQQLREVING